MCTVLDSGDTQVEKVGRHESSCKGNLSRKQRGINTFCYLTGMLMNWNADGMLHVVKIRR